MFNRYWSAVVPVAKQLAHKHYIAIDLSLTVPHFDVFQFPHFDGIRRPNFNFDFNYTYLQQRQSMCCWF